MNVSACAGKTIKSQADCVNETMKELSQAEVKLNNQMGVLTQLMTTLGVSMDPNAANQAVLTLPLDTDLEKLNRRLNQRLPYHEILQDDGYSKVDIWHAMTQMPSYEFRTKFVEKRALPMEMSPDQGRHHHHHHHHDKHDHHHDSKSASSFKAKQEPEVLTLQTRKQKPKGKPIAKVEDGKKDRPLEKSDVPALELSDHSWDPTDACKIEFKFPQLKRNVHWECQPWYDLNDIFYLKEDAEDDLNTHTHPTDPSITSDPTPALFSKHLSPLLEDGSIPPLTDELRLYFSTPDFADGDWIQFYGPGVDMNKISNMRITPGSICPGWKVSSFFSNGSSYHDGEWHLTPDEAEYQISIKWA